MSGIYCRDFPRCGQRVIGFITTVPSNQWSEIVMRYLNGGCEPFADEINIVRDTSTGCACHELTFTLKLDEKEPATLILEIFGKDFLDRYLPIFDRNGLARTGNAFLRIGSYENMNKEPTNWELFVLHELLVKQGTELVRRHWACVRDFDRKKLIDELVSGLNAADNRGIYQLVKQHDIEGGSWLLHPKDKGVEGKDTCMSAFKRIVSHFLNGDLQDRYISRVNYTTIKGVVKIYNEKTFYFDIMSQLPQMSAADKFRRDIQVKQLFKKLSAVGIQNMTLKYKPEIFSVVKLNSSNTEAFLTIYGDIRYDEKLNIAQESI